MAVANTNNISTFAPLDQGDLLISTENVTSTVWLNNNPTLFAYYTDTTQINSATGQFFITYIIMKKLQVQFNLL